MARIVRLEHTKLFRIGRDWYLKYQIAIPEESVSQQTKLNAKTLNDAVSEACTLCECSPADLFVEDR